MEPQLKIRVGANPNEDFQIMLGDVDVTDKFNVKSIDFHVDGVSGATVIDMACYVDDLEILPETARIEVVDKRRKGKIRQDERGTWYALPSDEVEDFERRDKQLRDMDGTEEDFDDLCASFVDLFESYRIETPEDVEVVIQ